MKNLDDAEEEYPDKDGLTFAAPAGLDFEDKKAGDTLEVVAELEIEEGGKLCLKKINGIEVEGRKPTPKQARSFAEAVTGETEDE